MIPTKEQHIDLQRRSDLRNTAPPAELDCRQDRSLRLYERLAEKEGEAGAENHQGYADRNVINTRSGAGPGVENAEEQPGYAGNQDAKPGHTSEEGDPVAAHRAHDEIALLAEINAAALFS